MGSKTISLEDTAYDALKAAKRPGESFSMVVRRLLAPQEDPMTRMVGLLSADKGDAMRELLDAKREADRDATIARYKRLGLL